MRWLYHALPAFEWAAVRERYAPSSLASEGFVHCSYRDRVAESARLYLPSDVAIVVLRIDPRSLDCELTVADTPRGPMPHVHGAIAKSAVVEVLALEAIDGAPDMLQ